MTPAHGTTVCDQGNCSRKQSYGKAWQLLETIPDAFWTDQYRNPSAMEAHYEMTARGIIAAFSSLDYVFVRLGTAGTIAAVSQRFKAHFPKVKVVAVDAEGSVIFG